MPVHKPAIPLILFPPFADKFYRLAMAFRPFIFGISEIDESQHPVVLSEVEQFLRLPAVDKPTTTPIRSYSICRGVQHQILSGTSYCNYFFFFGDFFGFLSFHAQCNDG